MSAFLFADRVKDTSSAQSSTVITLSNSPPTGLQSFNSGIGDGNFCVYLVSDGTHWEVNYGVYTNAGTTLARFATPISSSNSGSQVASFSGTVTVACVDPAPYMNGDIGLIGNGQGQYKNFFGNAFGTNTLTLNAVVYVPVWIKQWFTSYTVSVNVTTLAASSAISLGLYSNLAVAPNILLGTGQSGLSGASTGVKTTSSITCPSPQAPGLYWPAYLPLVASPAIEDITNSGADVGAMELIGSSGPSSVSLWTCYQQTGQSGGLPSTASGTATAAAVPYLTVAASF